MRRIRTNSRRSCQSGTQVVELALVLPILAALAFLVSEGAGLVRVHQVLNNAAREGARISAQWENHGKPDVARSAALAYVNSYVPTSCAPNSTDATVDQAYEMNRGGLTITGSKVTVTCQYSMSYLPRLWTDTPATFTLSSTATFRNFQ